MWLLQLTLLQADLLRNDVIWISLVRLNLFRIKALGLSLCKNQSLHISLIYFKSMAVEAN